MTRRVRVAVVLAGLIGVLCISGCDPVPDAPVETGGAPFLGPSSRVVPDPTPIPLPPPPSIPSKGIEPPLPAIPVHPQQPDYLDDEASRRRDAWLNERFRCRAISTTKLRGCKFERLDGGYGLKFQVSDVVCEDVEFDASGNPSRLIGCAGAWLRVPRNNTLKKAKRQDVWSGSHRGWKWKDGSKYCCPGMWLVPPKSIAR
jgi:hypothetical protein